MKAEGARTFPMGSYEAVFYCHSYYFSACPPQGVCVPQRSINSGGGSIPVFRCGLLLRTIHTAKYVPLPRIHVRIFGPPALCFFVRESRKSWG